MKQFYVPLRIMPKGTIYQWIRVKLKGKHALNEIVYMAARGYTPVPFSRHRNHFPRASNIKGCICVCGHILMERKHV